MVVFHGARDLEIFGLIAPGTTLSGVWYLLARLVAGSFFFFTGVSLVLAHGSAIRWSAFWRRFAVIGAAALAITAVTYVAMPSRYIYFGILHAIAVCSLFGLIVLRWPVALIFFAAAAILALHLSDLHPLTSAFWSFTGLSRNVRPALDLLPIIPWASALLLGVAFAKLWRPKGRRASGPIRILGWPGRHSLSIYLLHQPVLIAVLWVVARAFK